jgi:hypothetical protein
MTTSLTQSQGTTLNLAVVADDRIINRHSPPAQSPTSSRNNLDNQKRLAKLPTPRTSAKARNRTHWLIMEPIMGEDKKRVVSTFRRAWLCPVRGPNGSATSSTLTSETITMVLVSGPCAGGEEIILFVAS